MSSIDVAKSYLQAGLCVLPADGRKKRPLLSRFTQYQKCLPTHRHIEHWFSSCDSFCILTGATSGNLEILDFDHAGQAFAPWCERIKTECPGLLQRLTIERSQSGGYHLIYRCESPVPGSKVLARLRIVVDSLAEVELYGKKYPPHMDNGEPIITPLLIETRGQGGLFACSPTAGYELIQGSLLGLATVTDTERTLMVDLARSFNEVLPKVDEWRTNASPLPRIGNRLLPGDDFNERGEVRELLERHGWRCVQAGANEHWCRPGKQRGCSATFKNRVLYVFSSNAHPFEPDQAYSPFAVYTLLEHQGDFSIAASQLSRDGYGASDLPEIDLSNFKATKVEPPTNAYPDPGPVPDSMYRIPGFVSELMDHCLTTAPYPNQTLAFCGALALQATLAGRKVRDPGDNRTNLYLLGLAHSAAGKDWPRKLNTRILHDIGMSDCLGERFASGEGVQDALFLSPSMLFQTDEIDGILQSINKSRDARHESIMSTLLTMYSSANSVYPMRRKAGKESPGAIDQPSLVIFGTAIPNHYYEALSERMLTNGFFARMMILECGQRGTGQEPKIRELPPRVLEVAKWWRDFKPCDGNLGFVHPVPAIVPQDETALSLLVESRHQAEQEYAKAESKGDAVGTTVWGRVSEQVRRLALLYAVSRDHQQPMIDGDAVAWATKLVVHQTRRMLFMASGHVSCNEFDAMAKEMLRYLRAWKANHGDEPMPEWQLARRQPMKPSDRLEVVKLLTMQERVQRLPSPSKTKAGFVYRLLEN